MRNGQLTARETDAFVESAGVRGFRTLLAGLALTIVGATAFGQIIQEFPLLPPGRGPEGITTGPDGNLWFCEEGGNRIGRQTYPGGVVTEFVLPVAFSSPETIVTGPDGNLWFTAWTGRPGRPDHAGRRHHDVPDHLGEQRAGRDRGRCRRQHLVHRSGPQQDRPHHHRRSDDRVQPAQFVEPTRRHDRGPRRRPLVRAAGREPHRPHHDAGRRHPVAASDGRRRVPGTSPSARTGTSGSRREPPTRSGGSLRRGPSRSSRCRTSERPTT